jgi:hypothetical protein
MKGVCYFCDGNHLPGNCPEQDAYRRRVLARAETEAEQLRASALRLERALGAARAQRDFLRQALEDVTEHRFSLEQVKAQARRALKQLEEME